MKQLLSPKQVAEAFGVSESSLKRWCDQGIVPVERTPGGHRKIQLANVMHLLRLGTHELIRPEAIGFAAELKADSTSGQSDVENLVRCLGDGDTDAVRQIVFTQYLTGKSVSDFGDNLIGTAMHRIGDRWECGELEIFQERRACEILAGILHELRLAMGVVAGPLAMGGTPSGDPYRLATVMVELTLLEAGWSATSLGTSLPFNTLKRAVEQHQPSLFWLSISHLAERQEFEHELADWVAGVPSSTQIVLGGRQADSEWTSLGTNIHCCPNLVALRSFTDGLTQPKLTD